MMSAVYINAGLTAVQYLQTLIILLYSQVRRRMQGGTLPVCGNQHTMYLLTTQACCDCQHGWSSALSWAGSLLCSQDRGKGILCLCSCRTGRQVSRKLFAVLNLLQVLPCKVRSCVSCYGECVRVIYSVWKASACSTATVSAEVLVQLCAVLGLYHLST